VQALGAVCGRDLYFRARDGAWTFNVADSDGRFPADERHGSDAFCCEARFPDADWMSLEEAVAIIVHCLQEYTGVTV
jgi:hypothetical protein